MLLLLNRSSYDSISLSQKELEQIIKVLQDKEEYKTLYSKLWTFNFKNIKNGDTNGLS
jgi:translation elongation factor P/translation initiation factor 5A